MPSNFKAFCNTSNVYLADLDNSMDISVGDVVTINGEKFYLLSNKRANFILLLPEFNLDTNYRQSENNYYNTSFSDNIYWDDTRIYTNDQWQYTSKYYSWYLLSFYFRSDYTSAYMYIYRYLQNYYSEAEDNNLKDYFDNYKAYLQDDLGINVYDVRALSYEEALDLGCTGSYSSCPEYINYSDYSYWIGSLSSSSYLYIIANSTGDMTDRLTTSRNTGSQNVRPIIIVNASDIR